MQPLRRSLAVTAGLVALAACGDTARQPLAPPGLGPRLTVTSSIVVCPDTISVGQSAQCVAYFYDENNNLVSNATPTWSTTTSSVDAVSSSGVVTGVSVGNGNVKATYSGVTGTKNLYVKPGLSVSIVGPSLVPRWVTCTWSSSVSGGTAPYTYQWSDARGTGNLPDNGTSYSVDMISASDILYLTVTDANGVQQSVSKNVTTSLSAPPC